MALGLGRRPEGRAPGPTREELGELGWEVENLWGTCFSRLLYYEVGPTRQRYLMSKALGICLGGWGYNFITGLLQVPSMRVINKTIRKVRDKNILTVGKNKRRGPARAAH
jgi:hypothetical protein